MVTTPSTGGVNSYQTEWPLEPPVPQVSLPSQVERVARSVRYLPSF